MRRLANVLLSGAINQASGAYASLPTPRIAISLTHGGDDEVAHASQRSRVCTEILNSRETVSSEMLSGDSNRATALSSTAFPYLANLIF